MSMSQKNTTIFGCLSAMSFPLPSAPSSDEASPSLTGTTEPPDAERAPAPLQHSRSVEHPPRGRTPPPKPDEEACLSDSDWRAETAIPAAQGPLSRPDEPLRPQVAMGCEGGPCRRRWGATRKGPGSLLNRWRRGGRSGSPGGRWRCRSPGAGGPLGGNAGSSWERTGGIRPWSPGAGCARRAHRAPGLPPMT